MEFNTMFPVHVTVRNAEDLKKVYDLLGDGTADAPPAQAATPAKPAKPAKPVAEKAAPAQTAAPAAAAVPTISAAGQAFLQGKLAAPVMELSTKDEPKMKAICAKYGVERVSLIPEKFFPDVLDEVNQALDPGYAERKRLEAIDAEREGASAKPARSLL